MLLWATKTIICAYKGNRVNINNTLETNTTNLVNPSLHTHEGNPQLS